MDGVSDEEGTAVMARGVVRRSGGRGAKRDRVFRAALRSACAIVLLAGISSVAGTQPEASVSTRPCNESLDLCPMSPLFKIYAVHYCRRITPRSELIVGPYYANIHHEDIGHTNAPGFIVGYRRFFWRTLHADYQLMPQWDRYYEKNERKTYPIGFDLWNEFRLGYMWDFRLLSAPAFINVQWPFGFIVTSDPKGKPQSFKDYEKGHHYFYFPPMFFLGVRF